MFQNQILGKQAELAPWLEKIAIEQSAIDVAQSEYDILFERVNANEKALAAANSSMEELMEEIKSKVSGRTIFFFILTLFYVK